MEQYNLSLLLSQNSYPGRGILLGKSGDGSHAMIAYFIMGRSVNSRNRVFVEQDQGIRTQAFDPSKLSDPSLVIYAPVRVLGNDTIVTNGDQTDTIYDFLERGASFEDALRTRTFEPDSPNFTPRISSLLQVENGQMGYQMSILKSNNGNGDSCQRFFFDYPQPVAGEGHFIHTYRCDGTPIPSFEGEPEWIAMPETGKLEPFGDMIWHSLNQDNKVSLFVRSIRLSDGAVQTKIYNKLG